MKITCVAVVVALCAKALFAVSPEDAAPCRAFDPISPVRSFPAGNGGTIYDFGSNRTGWCEIEVVGEAGAKITIYYDECLAVKRVYIKQEETTNEKKRIV